MSNKHNILDEPVRIVPSGYRHPYFVTRRVSTHETSMLAKITAHPGLGRWTVLPASQLQIHFTVLFESNTDTVGDWQVEIWWGGDDLGWNSLSLHQSNTLAGRVLSTNHTEYHHWFEGAMKRPETNVRFTVRFKTRESNEWKWARDLSGIEDGRVLLQSNDRYSDDISNYVENLDLKHLSPHAQSSDSPDTALWVVTASAVPAVDDSSGWSKYRLGTVKHGQRWFALVRLMTPWLAPRHGRFMHELAKDDAILYSFLRDDGLHVVFVAVSGIDNVQTVFQHDSGALMVLARNDGETHAPMHIVVTVGRTFDSALAAAVYKARSLVSPYSQAPINNSAPPNVDEVDGGIRTNWVQDWYDGFAYCTWNGLGKQLTEDKLDHALQSMKDHGINITNLIIDDNWQSLDRDGESNMVQGWKDFEANPRGFPRGFSHAVRALREKHPDLQHIAVWHALLGYWGGISPEGKLAKTYRTRQVSVRRDAIIVDGSMLVVDPLDAAKLYNDFFGFLMSCTVDSVKTDAQFALDELTSARDRREMNNAYRSAWTVAHLTHFTGHAISCMSQTPYMLFASQLPNNTPTIPVRNSDDFFPNVDDSHPWHVYCNAYNSLFTKHLNVLPDWDMFQTSHKWATFHAAARCLSGGPIYVTDEPGKHNVDLIKQMTAQTSRAQTVILRPSVVGRSGDAYVSYDEDALLKIDAYNGPAKTGSSFSGFFNCRSWPLSHIVHLEEFMGLADDVKYVVRAYRSGIVSPALSRLESSAVFGLDVDAHSWEILSAHPVAELEVPTLTSRSVLTQVSVLGLISHMSGAAAVVSADAFITPVNPQAQPPQGSVPHRLDVITQLKALGVLGIWIAARHQDQNVAPSKDQMLVLLEGQVMPAEYVQLYNATQPGTKHESTVVSIDIENAWKHLGLSGTLSNEISVEMFLTLE